MNTDFLRTQSWHTQALNRFIDHENLYISLYHETADVSYTYPIIIIKHFLHLITYYCPKVSLTI